MHEEHPILGWTAVTVALLGFAYYGIQGLLDAAELLRLLPNVGMSMGVFAMGVHFIRRRNSDGSTSLALNVGLLVFCISVIALFVRDIMSN